MRVVVTGGAGFVGSHIVDALIARGDSVLVVDNLSTGRRENVNDEAEFLFADVWNAAHVFKNADAIVHAAAYADLRRNWESEAERSRVMRMNVDVTRAVLEFTPRHATLVFLSSASVYGSAKSEAPVREEDANFCTPESPYAASKGMGEMLVASWAFKNGFRWRNARLVNVVGARTTHGVIADFIRMLRDANHIHAADDGKQRKSWVHVADVADAVARMLAPDVANGTYAITSAERISWWEIVDELGVPRDRVTFEARDRGAIGDPHELHVSGDKLAAYYRPHRSVMSGVREAIASLGWKRESSTEAA